MSNSKTTQISTSSVSKNHHTQISPIFKELISSGGKTDLSLDLNQSFNNQESSIKDLSPKELSLLAELEALDISYIPNESGSASFIKASVTSNDRSAIDDNPLKLKPLILETTQVKHKWWCQSCIVGENKVNYGCFMM